jgi:hypothetical protein
MARDGEIDLSYVPTAEMLAFLTQCAAMGMIGIGLGNGPSTLGNGLGIGIGNGISNGVGNGHGNGIGIRTAKGIGNAIGKQID